MQLLELSTALPKKVYSTQELLDVFPCRLPEGVRQNVLNLGVAKRHLIGHPESESVMSEEELLKVCQEACENAIRKAELSVEDIDCAIMAYDVNPFLSPGLSQLLAPTLKLNPYCKLVNVQGVASTAFIKTLELADYYLTVHPKDNVLLCVSGISSFWFQNQVNGMKEVMEIGKINHIGDGAKREDELRKWVATMEFFLFGDGAAAAIAAKQGNGLSMEKTVEVTNVAKNDYLAGYARLSALNEPFKFGFYSHLDKDIPQLGAKYTDLALKRLLGEGAEEVLKNVKKWAVHTGSEKILNTLAERHSIDSSRLKESHEVLREYGNLAGASLPFILERITTENKFSKGDLILMLGYGWGFSASAAKLEYNE
jgi:3-oxoacyl-[acyl-carrier-protein] synthase III